MDWKDQLAALAAGLPQGSDTPEPAESPEVSAKKEKLSVFIERKGRKGKTATIVTGFACPDDELADVAAMLKRKLGVGGSARGGEILIQGECADRVKTLLKDAGYRL